MTLEPEKEKIKNMEGCFIQTAFIRHCCVLVKSRVLRDRE